MMIRTIILFDRFARAPLWRGSSEAGKVLFQNREKENDMKKYDVTVSVRMQVEANTWEEAKASGDEFAEQIPGENNDIEVTAVESAGDETETQDQAA
jgi:hypothetical protein